MSFLRPPSRHLSLLAIIALLAGCSSLPRDGPTARAVENGASNIGGHANYTIVDLNYATSERIKLQPPRFLGSLAGAETSEVGGLIGSGDSLAITIFEPSGALFGAGSSGTGLRSGAQNLPSVTVTSAGSVAIPFAGQVQVAGLNTTDAAGAIRRSLLGKVGNPQVLLTITENAFNAVTVLGEVRSPGRAPISSNLNRIVDVIASRGGVARPPEDVLVVINRGGQSYTAPLTTVTTDFAENVRLVRGDQVNLVYRPRRFSTFGALGAVTQVEMGAGLLSLTGALSKVGGLDTNSANARSILIFRFERPEIAQALNLNQPATNRGVPVVYRVDLEDAAGFFVANNFEIQSEDVVYVPRSGSAELGKFFTLVRTLTGAIYDISVTSALNTSN